MTRRVSLVFFVVVIVCSNVLFARKDSSKKRIRPGEWGSVTLTVPGTARGAFAAAVGQRETVESSEETS